MSENGSDKETKFWEFIKRCLQERVDQIGMEDISSEKYRELDDKLDALALVLKGVLSKDKSGLVDEYDNSMAEEESDGEDIFFWYGFMDGARMLWEKEGKVEVKPE